MNSVSNWSSVLQNHAGFEPKERDGLSVSELLTPAICIGVSGDAFSVVVVVQARAPIALLSPNALLPYVGPNVLLANCH